MPRLVAEQIGSSARFQANAAKLAAELGRPAAAVVREATDKMGTFVATQSRLMDDVLSSILGQLHERTWTVSADLDTMGHLRTLNKTHGLVFLPSHRSYVDPFVLAEVLRRRLPAQPGSRWRQFAAVAVVVDRATGGHHFIRRKFGSDPVYKFAMRCTCRSSSRSGSTSSGTSKAAAAAPVKAPPAQARPALVRRRRRRPRRRCRRDGGTTSIVYDQLHEIGAMAAEAAGARSGPRTWAGCCVTPSSSVSISAMRECASASRSRCVRHWPTRGEQRHSWKRSLSG